MALLVAARRPHRGSSCCSSAAGRTPSRWCRSRCSATATSRVINFVAALVSVGDRRLLPAVHDLPAVGAGLLSAIKAGLILAPMSRDRPGPRAGRRGAVRPDRRQVHPDDRPDAVRRRAGAGSPWSPASAAVGGGRHRRRWSSWASAWAASSPRWRPRPCATCPARLAGAASGVNNALRQVGSVLAARRVGAVLQNRLATTLRDAGAAAGRARSPRRTATGSSRGSTRSAGTWRSAAVRNRRTSRPTSPTASRP